MIFIKSLSKSDVQIVKEVFERQRAEGVRGKQQAIVLPRSLMRRFGYDFLEIEQGWEIPLSITFFGPGLRSDISHPNARLCRHRNDWRIHRCIIQPGEYESGRFDGFDEDDLFLISLDIQDGEARANACFISSREPEDQAIYAQLQPFSGAMPERDEIYELADSIHLGSDHGVYEVLKDREGAVASVDPSVEDSTDGTDHVELDAAQGGEAALVGKPGLSRQELEARLAEAARVGNLGESIFNAWLATCPEIGGLRCLSHRWIASEVATSPYDFEITLEDGSVRQIELKSTAAEHQATLYLSGGEIENMRDAPGGDVILARLCKVDECPGVAFAFQTRDAALRILDGLRLPDEVEIVSVSVDPGYFEFDVEGLVLPALEVQSSFGW